MDAKQMRHCAFCLQEISGPLIKKCGGCKKRAYCSKECQTADWSVSGSGQRHKNWCRRYEYGEEDIDWEVVPVENKGLGVVAKRLLPAGYRIIVEPVYADVNGHPGIKDLEPKGASLEAKFKLNAFGGYKDRDGGKPLLGLRTSRVNHSCCPNAGISYDEAARVRIIVAQKDIQPGEEICIIYSFFGCLSSNSPKNEPSKEDKQLLHLLRAQHGYVHPEDGLSPEDQEFADIKRSLRVNWGITCPTDCYCTNPQIRKLVLQGKKLHEKMHSLAAEGRVEDALKTGDELLKIDAQLNTSWGQRAGIYFKLFEMSNQLNRSKEEMMRTRQYLQSTHSIHLIISPYSEITGACAEGLSRYKDFF